jgi:hypothetical protein
VKPLPLTAADEMLRLDPPELVNVRLCVWLLPTRTLLLKIKLEGAFRSPGVGAVYPDPESATDVLLMWSLFCPPQEPENVIANEPLKLLAAGGENATDKFADCCGDNVIGRFGPTKLNPVPEASTCEIVSVDLPVLFTAAERMVLLPTCTLPKLTLVDESDICAFATAGEMERKETRRRLQQESLQWVPRRLMCSLSFAVPRRAAGDCRAPGVLALSRLDVGPRNPPALFIDTSKDDSSVGHRGSGTSGFWYRADIG